MRADTEDWKPDMIKAEKVINPIYVNILEDASGYAGISRTYANCDCIYISKCDFHNDMFYIVLCSVSHDFTCKCLNNFVAILLSL